MNYIERAGKEKLIMGILNVTPDSFSDGGEFLNTDKAIEKAVSMINDGVDIIDIGGQSTRPGFSRISASEEMKRIEPILNTIKQISTIPISVDTFYSAVAIKSLELGADIINDVSGVIEEQTIKAVSESGKYLVITCNKELIGNDIVSDTAEMFDNMAEKADSLGLKKEKLIFDPGFGFHKTFKQDAALLKNIGKLTQYNPLLIGLSRKRIIGALSGIDNPINRDDASLTAAIYAYIKGVNIVRTHNVGVTKKAFDILGRINEQ